MTGTEPVRLSARFRGRAMAPQLYQALRDGMLALPAGPTLPLHEVPAARLSPGLAGIEEAIPRLRPAGR
jgi:hypothetical protein